MTKVKMPDPVAWVTVGEQKHRQVWFTEQECRAYAAAKVREALEEAAQACEARIGTHAPGLSPEDVEDCDEEARCCADAIRFLIHKE